jgi:hypothetical protein
MNMWSHLIFPLLAFGLGLGSGAAVLAHETTAVGSRRNSSRRWMTF